MRRGYEYNYRLHAVQVDAHAGPFPPRRSFIALDDRNVVLTAVKKAEDRNALIVRFYEWAGEDGSVRIQVPKGATTARLANLMEQPEGTPLAIENGNVITVPTHPYEIVTVDVEYPASAQ